ncbi:MAG: hypothetical protein J6Y02_12380 [Pseudobutyrivibrio sp.]|nr:hypothetical protein [Pseudobutyrivibrio sp.]
MQTTPFKRAIDPEARERQLIGLSYNLVEQRLLDGTASAQEVCHFLKLGSMEKQLELEKMKNENVLVQKKVEALDSQIASDAKLQEVIDAFKSYSGVSEE